MIENVGITGLNTSSPMRRDILFKFKDDNLKEETYNLLKEHLLDYKLDMSPDYGLKIDTKYHGDFELLIIGFILQIPETMLPMDEETCLDVLEEEVYPFMDFYENLKIKVE